MLQGVQRKGLFGQRDKAPSKGGLVHVMDEWLVGKEDQSSDFVISSCEDILEYARFKYCC